MGNDYRFLHRIRKEESEHINQVHLNYGAEKLLPILCYLFHLSLFYYSLAKILE